MAKLGAMMWLTREEVATLPSGWQDQLTFCPSAYLPGETIEPIEAWVDTEGGVGVPVDWGIATCEKAGIPFSVELSRGEAITVRRLPDPFHEKAAPGQDVFFEQMLDAATGFYTSLIQAPTGAGKTVSLLHTIGKLGRKALVIVPNNVLAEQWKSEAVRHLGLTAEEVGIIGDGAEEWEGRAVVIAVVHNLVQKSYPDKFYSLFGFVAWDEVHRLGARSFSQSLGMFPAKYRVGVSATPDRKDGCAGLFIAHLGSLCVRSKQKVLPVDWRVEKFHLGRLPGWAQYCQATTKQMKWISEHRDRNQWLVDIIVELFEQGRTVLGITKFVDHAETILSMLLEAGIPASALGQFTRQRSATRVVCDKKTGEETVKEYRRAVKQAELDDVARNAQIIIATDSMMKEGVDIARLDAGVELLPMPDPRQAVGRIRRPLPGKPKPIWVSIQDPAQPNKGFDFLIGYARSRTRRMGDVGIKQV